MKFHQHSSNNLLLGKPLSSKNVETMPATMIVGEEGEATVASFWRPDPEELAILNSGGSVVLYVFGTAHPPVAIGVIHG